MKNAFAVVGGIILVVALIVGATYGDLALYSDAAPRFKVAERQVFENTPSYVQDKSQLLTRLRLDYEKA